MASKTFLLLALVFAFCLLITSEVFAEDLASNHNGEVDGRGGYNKGDGHGGYIGGERGGHIVGGHIGHGIVNGHTPYRAIKGCRHGCCGRGGYKTIKGCKCCSSFEEATAYKQTQN